MDLETRNKGKDEREEEDESLKALRETMGFSSFEYENKKSPVCSNQFHTTSQNYKPEQQCDLAPCSALS